MKNNNNIFILNFGIISILVCILFYILYIWASLIIPFVVSILLAFSVLGLSTFFKEKCRMNAFFAMIFSLLTYILIFYIIWIIISSNINDIIKAIPLYQEKVIYMFSETLKFFKIQNPENLAGMLFWKVDFQAIISSALGNITSVLSNVFVIFFTTMFILMEAGNFWEKLALIFDKDNERKKYVFETIDKVKLDIKNYFMIKTFVSFLIGFWSYLIMLGFWLDFALFWWVLFFLLNFIPFIGSIIATVFPIILALVQLWIYDSIFLLVLFLVIQNIVWNFIEPKMMWTRLNLSPLVILLSLSFWWVIWWVWGMLLSIPIMVTINIILARIPETRGIAILLSEKWYLQVEAVEKKKKTILDKVGFKKKK